MTLHAALTRFKWLALLAGASWLCMGAHAAESRVSHVSHVSGGRYGDVTVEWPQGEMRGFVVGLGFL